MLKFRERLASRSRAVELVDPRLDVIVIDADKTSSGLRLRHGHMRSPLARHTPEFIPPPVCDAQFELVEPANSATRRLRPLVIHLAGTGDHGFARRRRFMARPLAEQYGIASLILENPFYGPRKPKRQL